MLPISSSPTRLLFALLPIILVNCLACGQSTVSTSTENQNNQPDDEPLPDCEWCGAMDAPADVDWQATIAPPDEKGEPLTLSGIVYQPDGVTPAKDILIYAYHTNSEGIYPKRDDETGNGRRHGYLRAWAKTNEQGHFQFKTIRPETYPSRNEPAHIHLTISGPGIDEYWLNALHFSGDPLLNQKHEAVSNRTGGTSNIISLKKDENGVWQGEKNILLEKRK